MKQKVVLAYSGGLDTSVILKWLIKDKNYDVIAYIADVGQNEDFKEIEKRAYETGASKVYIEDLKKELVEDYIYPMIRANAIYEGRYLLGTSIARPIIAKRQLEIAEMEKAAAVAHGSTGKGNDQIRFELTYYALAPTMKVIAPWKDISFLREFKGRTDMINYAKANRIKINVTKSKPFSSDPNIFHISYEAGELEDPMKEPREDMFMWSVSPAKAPDKKLKLRIEFEKGTPVRVSDLNSTKAVTGSVKILTYLNKVAGENGVGRVDIVENRAVGLKSRGVYETPGGTILYQAHRDLEGITMDREVMHLRDMLSPKFAELIYNGLWFAPERSALSAFFDKSQEFVTGSVDLFLYKGNIVIVGRKSPFSMYDEEQASMDVLGSYDPVDAGGFIRINALRLIKASLQEKKINSSRSGKRKNK
jgi:argininosuccinate synthase